MFEVIGLFMAGLVLGLMAVASNPSPYFAALGLVVVSGMGCGILVTYGGSFLSLVLFLIYLGGMLVVFAYSTALAAEPYPEGWFSGTVALYMGLYFAGVTLISFFILGQCYDPLAVPVDEEGDFFIDRSDSMGVALMYAGGGGMLVLSAWMLLLTLFAVLELTRGAGRGTVRAV